MLVLLVLALVALSVALGLMLGRRRPHVPQPPPHEVAQVRRRLGEGD